MRRLQDIGVAKRLGLIVSTGAVSELDAGPTPTLPPKRAPVNVVTLGI